MENVSFADVQELVRRLPEAQLPHAYRMLRDLAEQQVQSSPQQEFMRLPLNERCRLLTQQADEMASHYEQTTAERQDWQCGAMCEYEERVAELRSDIAVGIAPADGGLAVEFNETTLERIMAKSRSGALLIY